MVIFNPQVQPDNRFPTEWGSRPISDIPADKSTALALTTLGEGLESGVAIAEKVDTDIIKDKTRAGVEAIRGATTLAYEDIRKAQAAGVQPSDTALKAAGWNASLLNNNPAQDAPEALQAGLSRAENLGLARSQVSNKVNDTLYTAALDSLAKQLRNEYPGHKDFIDEQISKISGKNPANAYMENLLTDINRAAVKEDTFTKTILAKAKDNLGDAEVQKYWLAVQSGHPNAMAGLTKAVFEAESLRYKHEGWKRQNEESKGDTAADADLAKSQMQQRAASVVARHFNPVLELPGLTTPQMQQRILDDYRAGRLDYPSLPKDAWNQMLSNAQMARDRAANEVKSVFNNEGYSRRLKNPTEEQQIANNELQFLDRQIEAIKNKDVGTMFDLQRRSRALQDNANFQAESGPMGEYLLKSKVIKDHLGDSWINRLDAIGLEKGYLGKFHNWFNDESKAIGVPDDIRRDGQVKSLYGSISKAREFAKTQNVPPKLYDDLVYNVDQILTAKENNREDIAKQIVKYTFDPAKNGKLMELFGKDFTDETGTHKGRFAVNQVLSRPKVVDAIYGLGDRDSWEMMKNTREVWFKTLFGEEVNKLNKLQGEGSLPIGITWDDKNKRLVLDPVKTVTNVDRNYIENAQRSIRALNGALGDLAYMYGKEGDKDQVDAKLFGTLMSLGYSPNDRLHGDNLPQRVIEAIETSKKPKSSIEEVSKMTR